MAPASRPWWVIGSAAVAIHGAAADDVHDIDVLLDPADAESVFARCGIAALRMPPDTLFCSTLFARWEGMALPVEFMAGFAVARDGGWQPIAPASRLAVSLGRRTLYVPDRRELATILRCFGRPKDLVRAAALEGREPG